VKVAPIGGLREAVRENVCHSEGEWDLRWRPRVVGGGSFAPNRFNSLCHCRWFRSSFNCDSAGERNSCTKNTAELAFSSAGAALPPAPVPRPAPTRAARLGRAYPGCEECPGREFYGGNVNREDEHGVLDVLARPLPHFLPQILPHTKGTLRPLTTCLPPSPCGRAAMPVSTG
jgi:hypothetical protein